MSSVAKLAQRAGLFYGWRIVAAAGAMAAVAGGTFFFGFSAVFDPIVREFRWSRAATSYTAGGKMHLSWQMWYNRGYATVARF